MAEKVSVEVQLKIDQAQRDLEAYRKEAEATKRAVGGIGRAPGARAGGRSRQGAALRGGGGQGTFGQLAGAARDAGSKAGAIIAILVVILALVKLTLANVQNIARIIDDFGFSDFAAQLDQFGDDLNEKLSKLAGTLQAGSDTAETARRFSRAGVTLSPSDNIQLFAAFKAEAERQAQKEQREFGNKINDYTRLIANNFRGD